MNDSGSATDIGVATIAEFVRGYRSQKGLAEGALEQLDDAEWHQALDPESNSVSVIVRHVAGNLRSRFTDFLTTDGEKPDRNRDGEFDRVKLTVPAMMAEWEQGFGVVMDALAGLSPDDLSRTVTIRGEPYTVLGAVTRNYAHTAQHVGQIVMLAKHLRGERWRTLSIPRKR